MKARKIVITGGPGTGKTSLVKSLELEGHRCLHEVSRKIILEAQKEGISQLFLEKPLLFSELLLEKRIQQYKEAEKSDSDVIFIDRGIPDVVAYMDYFGNDYPPVFNKACKEFKYDRIFLLPPWKNIYISDNERYETFEQAMLIDTYLQHSYKKSGYKPVLVPFGDLKQRTNFILNHIS